jgi:hypothetical protein
VIFEAGACKTKYTGDHLRPSEIGSCLSSSDEVVKAAEKAVREIIKSYRRPKMTAEDIRRQAYLEIKDPVKEFGEACRRELNGLYPAVSSMGGSDLLIGNLSILNASKIHKKAPNPLT